jgi:hypothetical protein
MSIPKNHSTRYVYHFTSAHNLASVLEHGLLCTNVKKSKGITHIDVANAGIQGRRSRMLVPGAGGKCVHDYVPFYFAQKTPMQLAVLNKKNVDQELIIYFAVPLRIMESRPGVYFTDASANTEDPPTFYPGSAAENLTLLNWAAIDSAKWKYPDEERHQKMAELLIPESVSLEEIEYIVVWNDAVGNEVKKAFESSGLTCPRIECNQWHYYPDMQNKRYSFITGPFFLKMYFENAVESIISYKRGSHKFDTLEEALAAVRASFVAIEELAGIDGLRASYGPHNDDVGTHSRRVANLVKLSKEYSQLEPRNQSILEMSAYLHDIGKGPKSRWVDSYMDKPDNNHARKSIPMLERILKEDIGGLSGEEVRKLVMLVTYDDLLGDIVRSEDDVNMLVALSQADISSLNAIWFFSTQATIERLRQEAIAYIKGK